MEGSPNPGTTRPADWLGEDILTEITNHYTVRRQNWGFEIFVCQFMNGPKLGSIAAFPRVAWTSAQEQFWGSGSTAQLALADCLRKSHQATYELMFPKQQ